MAKPFVLAFTDPAELEGLIEEYFESRWDTRTIRQHVRGGDPIEFEEKFMRPPTMAGLARHLGVVRGTLWNYQARTEEDDPIRPVIARALNRIAEFAEEALYTREGNQGARFSLEVNHRYGKEEGGSEGGGFSQTVIAPAVEKGEPLAIPKWGEQDATALKSEERDE